MVIRVAVVAAACWVALAAESSAQVAARPGAIAPAHTADSGGRNSRAPWYAGVASLAVPGSGQALLGQSRTLAYAAVEIYAFLEYRVQRIEAVRGRDRYRALARDVARAVATGPRPLGPFEYYESMEKYIESGAFDRVPGGDVDPELDERTFNGSIWRLARETFWDDPDLPPPVESAAFASAISMYLRRAALPEFAWSWRNAALEHDLYRRSIQRSNAASRRAREQLGVLLANHLLSMADAVATIRIRAPASLEHRTWGVVLAVPLPTAGKK